MRAIHAGCGAFVCLALACGGTGGAPGASQGGGLATVHGFVAPGARPLDHARALAVSADGKVLWTHLDASAAFTLAVPAGGSYRILIANELDPAGTRLRVVGHLVLHTPQGPDAWLGVGDAAPIALGALHLAGAATGGAHLNDVDPGSSDGNDSSSGTDDQGDTHEDDTDHLVTCVSDDGESDDDQELDSDSEQGDQHADPEHEGDDGEGEDGNPCPPSNPPSHPLPPGVQNSRAPTGVPVPR